MEKENIIVDLCLACEKIANFTNEEKALLFLDKAKTCSPKYLMENLLMEKPNVSNLMKKLCSKDLVKISKTEKDNKFIYYSLTSLGLANADSIKKNLSQKFVADLNPDIEKSVQALLNFFRR